MLKIIKKKNNSKRFGRGIASGKGKTAGRGTKGQNSRSGHKRHTGFTTGATPLHMKLPKLVGNKVVKKYATITSDTIESKFSKEDQISKKEILNKGIINRITSSTVIKIVLGKKQTFPYKLDKDIKYSKSIKTA